MPFVPGGTTSAGLGGHGSRVWGVCGVAGGAVASEEGGGGGGGGSSWA